MNNATIQIIVANEIAFMDIIADWYQKEWSIPPEKTRMLLQKIASSNSQYHFILVIDDEAVATAGLHEDVGITAVEPALKKIKNWLAMVYTVPKHRNKGYASLLCTHIEQLAKENHINKLHLFTHTAEHLYRSLRWKVVKRIHLNQKNIVIMEKKTRDDD